MNKTRNCVVAAAIRLHERLVGKQKPNDLVCLPSSAWKRIFDLQRRIAIARARGWHAAANRLHDDLLIALRDCHRQLDEIIRGQQPFSHTPSHIMSVADVYRDLVALNDEFDCVDIDLEEQELSVTTDSITLEGVYLGPFQIRLKWSLIGEASQPYRVVAVDPNPARKSEDITHPHVQDEHLCEGDGHVAISTALAAGRFYDFFMLASQVLHNYGRGSAYVELDDWDGVPCADCGNVVDQDDRYHCNACNSVLCDDCSLACQSCDSTFCNDCLSACAGCELYFCSTCLETCATCHRRVCEDCHESGLCSHCHQKEQEEHENESTENELEQEPVAAIV